MIYKYFGKVNPAIPNPNVFPMAHEHFFVNGLQYIDLEKVFYFFMNYPLDPVLIQHSLDAERTRGKNWLLHPGWNRTLGVSLRGETEWMDCIIVSEVELTSDLEWLQLGELISVNKELDLANTPSNWEIIAPYVTSETTRDDINRRPWIRTAKTYTCRFLGDLNVNIHLGSKTLRMNENGTRIVDITGDPNKAFRVIQKTFNKIRKRQL